MLQARQNKLLTFNEEKHEYYLDGVKVPWTVTEIPKEARLIDEEYFTEESRQRGMAVHLATKYLDEGHLDWECEAMKDPRVRPYVEGYQAFLDETGFVSTSIEQMIHDEVWGYAGRYDRTGTMPRRAQPILAEVKTGAYSDWWALQLAGYEARLSKRHLRLAIQLMKTGRYKIHWFKDPNDIKVFRALITGNNWKRNHRR